MKKNLLGSLLILSLFNLNFAQTAKVKQPAAVKPATPKADAPKAVEVPFVNKVLPNGLEVIVLADKSVPIATVELAVRNGSFTEPPELNGLSHLYEHMFFKPNQASLLYRCELALQYGNTNYYTGAGCGETIKFKPQIGNVAYLNDAEQLDIYNGTTREEVVNYYYTTTSPFLLSAMRLINDAVRFPTFDAEELAQEKQVVIGEIDRNEANPFFYLDRALKEKLFYKYPTRKQPLGTRETVLGATTDKMRLIQSRYYVPNNAALVVTGDVNPDEVFRLAEQTFGSWERRKIDPFQEFPLVEHPPLAKSEGVVVEQPINSVVIQVGWHGPSIGKDDTATYAADVFSFILAQPDSRFQRALVDSGLAVDAQIGYYTQRNVGPIQLSLITTPDKAKAALKAAYAEIAQFDKPDYFTNEELENAKTILESRDLFEREKLSDYAHTLGFWWSSTGIDYFRGYYKNLRAISRADTNRYVKTYIQGKPRVGIALLSPDAQAKAEITPEDLIGK
ncbi:MAG TPA: pitrilysin family protein [Pyrinomonadaceae bacterium]|nr:pitrilysin family protein [Pyrinomonadaceae bacterium]